MMQALEDFLQLHGHPLSVDTQMHPVRIQGEAEPRMQGRHYRLNTPMRSKDFTTLAEFADCLSKADALSVERMAENLSRDFFMLETGGANR